MMMVMMLLNVQIMNLFNCSSGLTVNLMAMMRCK